VLRDETGAWWGRSTGRTVLETTSIDPLPHWKDVRILARAPAWNERDLSTPHCVVMAGGRLPLH